MNALSALVLAALQAMVPAGARLELRQFRPGAACAATAAEVRQPVRGSGAVAVRLTGPGCASWGWADVAVFVPARLVSADVREGQPIPTVAAERELTGGRSFVSTVEQGAVATRALPKGTALEPQHVRSAGPAAGTEITVVAQTGALRIEQRGRVVPCPGAQTCALLNNGRRVSGTFDGARLFLEIR